MKKSFRSLVLLAGVASFTALGCNFALAEEASATAAPAQADHQHGCNQGKPQRGHRFFQRLAKKLALTDQQKVQAKAIFKDNRAQAKPTLDSLKAERHRLRSLIQSGSADEAATRAQSAKVAALQADLAVQRAKGAKQLLALLTPDQQAKLKALQAQWEHNPREFGHHGAGPEE